MVKQMIAVALFSVASICYGDTFDFFDAQEITDNHSSNYLITAMKFVSDDVFVVTYVEVGETCDLQSPEGSFDSYIVAGKIDGSEVLYGTPLKWRSGEAFGNYCTCPTYLSIAKLDEFKFVLAYSDTADYGNGAAQVGCVDDETFAITMGDRSVFHGRYCDGTTTWTDETVCTSDSDCGIGVDCLENTGQHSLQQQGLWDSTLYGCIDVSVMSPSTDFFVVAYSVYDTATACRIIRPAVISGTQITWGEAAGGDVCADSLLESTQSQQSTMTMLDSTHFVWVWRRGHGSDYDGKMAIVTISGSSLTIGNTYEWSNDHRIASPDIVKIDSDTVAVSYGDMDSAETRLSLINVDIGTDTFNVVATAALSNTWNSYSQLVVMETNHLVATSRTSTSQFLVTDAEVDGNTLTIGDTSTLTHWPKAMETFDDGGCLAIVTFDPPILRSYLAAPTPPAKPLPENASGLSCDDVSDCSASPNGFLCTDELCYTRKNRYLSIREDTANAGSSTARRIQWKEDPQSTALTIGWVGEPDANGFAPISDTAHYTDWTTEPAVIHVYGCAISPDLDYVYLVQSIYQGKSTSAEYNFSEPLTLGTAHFGDITNATLNGPPDGVANLSDILAACNAISNNGQPFPAIQYTDITGTDAMENIPNQTVNMSDLLDVIDAFGSGNPYSYHAPDACP